MKIIGRGVETYLTDLPISLDALQKFRFDAKQLGPSEGLGAHIRRRHGQSLEFNEYREYQFGGDIRTVDWRASIRAGDASDWIVRTFEAEEHLTVAITVDVRPSMYLPFDPAGVRGDASKVQVASWLVLAFAELTAQENDKLLLHRLFRTSGGTASRVKSGDLDSARQFATELIQKRPVEESEWSDPHFLDAENLLAALPPASVLVVISDLYFENDTSAFTDMLIRAQRNYREVVLVRLDSWPSERQLLLRGVNKLQGVEGVALDDTLVEVDEAFVKLVRMRIDAHVEHVLRRAQVGGFISGVWSWPDVTEKIATRLRDRFATQFLEYEPFLSIFARQP